MGLPLKKHKAKQIDKELADWADLILTMEAAQVEQIEAMFPEAEPKTHTLKGYAAGGTGLSGPGYDVSDPYGEDLMYTGNAPGRFNITFSRSLQN